MSKKYTFTATIIGTGGGGAYVPIPFDVEQAFGKKRVRYRLRLMESLTAAPWYGWTILIIS
jgi:rRNA maturation protein Nop10